MPYHNLLDPSHRDLYRAFENDMGILAERIEGVRSEIRYSRDFFQQAVEQTQSDIEKLSDRVVEQKQDLRAEIDIVRDDVEFILDRLALKPSVSGFPFAEILKHWQPIVWTILMGLVALGVVSPDTVKSIKSSLGGIGGK